MERRLDELKTALRHGVAKEEFSVGTVILDRWCNVKSGEVLDAPLVVVDYRVVRMKAGEALGVVLLRKDALMKICFSLDGNLYAPSVVSSWLATDYEQGCSEILRSMAVETEIELLSGKMLVKHFLPSLTELRVHERKMSYDGRPWEYFRRNEPWWRMSWSTDDGPLDCWLRSEYKGLNRYAWVLSAGRKVLLYNVKSTSMCMPACIVI